MYQPTSLGNAFLEACAILFFLCLLLLALISLFKVPNVDGGAQENFRIRAHEAVLGTSPAGKRGQLAQAPESPVDLHVLPPPIQVLSRTTDLDTINQLQPLSAAPAELWGRQWGDIAVPASPISEPELRKVGVTMADSASHSPLQEREKVKPGSARPKKKVMILEPEVVNAKQATADMKDREEIENPVAQANGKGRDKDSVEDKEMEKKQQVGTEREMKNEKKKEKEKEREREKDDEVVAVKELASGGTRKKSSSKAMDKNAIQGEPEAVKPLGEEVRLPRKKEKQRAGDAVGSTPDSPEVEEPETDPRPAKHQKVKNRPEEEAGESEMKNKELEKAMRGLKKKSSQSTADEAAPEKISKVGARTKKEEGVDPGIRANDDVDESQASPAKVKKKKSEGDGLGDREARVVSKSDKRAAQDEAQAPQAMGNRQNREKAGKKNAHIVAKEDEVTDEESEEVETRRTRRAPKQKEAPTEAARRAALQRQKYDQEAFRNERELQYLQQQEQLQNERSSPSRSPAPLLATPTPSRRTQNAPDPAESVVQFNAREKGIGEPEQRTVPIKTTSSPSPEMSRNKSIKEPAAPTTPNLKLPEEASHEPKTNKQKTTTNPLEPVQVAPGMLTDSVGESAHSKSNTAVVEVHDVPPLNKESVSFASRGKGESTEDGVEQPLPSPDSLFFMRERSERSEAEGADRSPSSPTEPEASSPQQHEAQGRLTGRQERQGQRRVAVAGAKLRKKEEKHLREQARLHFAAASAAQRRTSSLTDQTPAQSLLANPTMTVEPPTNAAQSRPNSPPPVWELLRGRIPSEEIEEIMNTRSVDRADTVAIRSSGSPSLSFAEEARAAELRATLVPAAMDRKYSGNNLTPANDSIPPPRYDESRPQGVEAVQSIFQAVTGINSDVPGDDEREQTETTPINLVSSGEGLNRLVEDGSSRQTLQSRQSVREKNGLPVGPPDTEFPLTAEEEKRRLRRVDDLVAERERREDQKKRRPPSNTHPVTRNDFMGLDERDAHSDERAAKVTRPASSNSVIADIPVEEVRGASKPLSDMEDAKQRRRRVKDSAPGSPVIEEPVPMERVPEEPKESSLHNANNAHNNMLETPSWSFAGLPSSPTHEPRKPGGATHHAQVSESSETLQGQPITQPGSQKQAGKSFGHRRKRPAIQLVPSAGHETVQETGNPKEGAKAAPPPISLTGYGALGDYQDVSPITPERGTQNDKITAARRTQQSPFDSQAGPPLTDLSLVSPENPPGSHGQPILYRPKSGRHDNSDEIISRPPRRQQGHNLEDVIAPSVKRKQRRRLREAAAQALLNEEQVNASQGHGFDPATPGVRYPPANKSDTSKASHRDTGGPMRDVNAVGSAWFAVKESPFWTSAAVMCTVLYILGARQFFALAQMIGNSAPSAGAVRREVERAADPTQSALTWLTAKAQWLDSMSLFALLNAWHLVSILFIMMIIQVMQTNMEASSKSDGTTSTSLTQRLKAGPATAWAHVKTFGAIVKFQGVVVVVQGLCVLASIGMFAACLLYLDFLVNRLAALSPSMMNAQQSGKATVIFVNIVFLVFVPTLLVEFILCLRAYLRFYRSRFRHDDIEGDGKPSGAWRRLFCHCPC